MLDWRLVGLMPYERLEKGILAGLRVVEGSAFVAAPLGGMTLAQLGADVIRYDQIGGGLDYGRWPVAGDRPKPLLGRLNKGKRSIQIDLRAPEGKRSSRDSSPRRGLTRHLPHQLSRRAAPSTTRRCKTSETT